MKKLCAILLALLLVPFGVFAEESKDAFSNRFGEKINLDVIHSHNLKAAEEFRRETLANFPNIGEVNIFPLSLSVSCHIGPGSLALTCSKVHPEIW